MPLFKRDRKQDEEDLQWLYRNLQDLDEDAPAREDAAEETPADSIGDDVGAVEEVEPASEPVLAESPPPEPILPEPKTPLEPPPIEAPTPISREALLASEEAKPATNEPQERRNKQMSGNRRENAPFANRGQQSPQPRPKRQDSPPAEAATDTIVGPQSYFTGTFRSEKDLRIEGTFEGEIDCRGTVIVAKDATLSATVRARNIEIAGAVTGDVFIEERLHLRSSGEMRGQSHAASFIVEEGGYFEGEMKMGATDQEDWPTIGNGSASEGMGLSIEPTQWSSKRSEGRVNRPAGGQIDSGREDAGSGLHRGI